MPTISIKEECNGLQSPRKILPAKDEPLDAADVESASSSQEEEEEIIEGVEEDPLAIGTASGPQPQVISLQQLQQLLPIQQNGVDQKTYVSLPIQQNNGDQQQQQNKNFVSAPSVVSLQGVHPGQYIQVSGAGSGGNGNLTYSVVQPAGQGNAAGQAAQHQQQQMQTVTVQAHTHSQSQQQGGQHLQTVTVDGQEAVFIPGGANGLGTLVSPHLLRAAGTQNAAPANHLLQSAATLFPGQNVSVRPNATQVLQLQQSTIPVQVPIQTSSGQTIYQTVHFPVQSFSSVPNTIMAAPMVTQVPQHQQMNAPQMAQVVLPSGQIQHIQVVSPAPQQHTQQQHTIVIGQNTVSSAGGQTIVVQQPQTTYTSSAGQQQTTTTTSLSSQAVSSSSANSHHEQPIIIPQQQHITIEAVGGGNQVTLIPASSLTNLGSGVTLRNNNLVQFPSPNIQTINVPGIGNVQLIPTSPAPPQVAQPIIQTIPGGAIQIISAGGSGGSTGTDNSGERWQVVGLANQAAATNTTTVQPTNATLLQPSNTTVLQSSNATGFKFEEEVVCSSDEKPRAARRVACSCPNCVMGGERKTLSSVRSGIIYREKNFVRVTVSSDCCMAERGAITLAGDLLPDPTAVELGAAGCENSRRLLNFLKKLTDVTDYTNRTE
ncbi:unnamed protein product [Nesidiocoris tenuis]|uniref:Transcription factor Sp4 n=1 Tax=Nesidiocoris tenuis TaxID=355587 RepID=A0A6H5GPQ1_9HEMI|nr:unnamed protein product [Nesidiocoris tenuis]